MCPIDRRPLCFTVLLSCSYGLRRLLAGCESSLYLYADGPYEAQEFSCDGRYHLLLVLSFGQELAVAAVQPVLRLPGNLLHLRAGSFLPHRERRADRRAMPVGPGGLDHDTPEMRVASLGDAAAAGTLSARVLARNRAAVPHELSRFLEARDLSELCHDRHGGDFGNSAQRLQGLDDRAHPRGHRLDGSGNTTLQAQDALVRMLDLVDVVRKRDLLCGLFEVDFFLGPGDVVHRPGLHSCRRSSSVPQEELRQPVSGTQLVLFGREPRPYEIPQRLVCGIRDPHRCQVAGTVVARELR